MATNTQMVVRGKANKEDTPQRYSKLWTATLKTQGSITIYDPNLM